MSQSQTSSQRLKLTLADLDDDLNVLPIPLEIFQIELDTLNVLEGRVDINDFPPDYQEEIKNYYRFYGTRYNSKNVKIAKRTNDTLDIV